MISILNKIFGSKRTVSVELAENVKLTVVHAAGGGAHATLEENTGMFLRREQTYFASIDDLAKSLMLTDNRIIGKLSKAF